jgi:hypothetical protein
LDEEGRREMRTYELNRTDIKLFKESADCRLTYVLIEATINSFAFVKLIAKHVRQIIVANTFELKSISA